MPQEQQESPTATGLQNLGEMYRIYQQTNNKAPKSFAEVRTVEDAAPGGLTGLDEASTVVYWGADLTSLGEMPGAVPSDKVLAYDKTALDSGGFVLMLDRTVKKMTADELKAAPKAGTEPAAAAPAK